jgi:hypothetical protein
MGKPKELKMPKGKILMGKKTPKPDGREKKPVPSGPKQFERNPGDRKRALPMPKLMPDAKKRPLPMPKGKPGKPAPKGGKVIEKKLPPKNVYKSMMKKNEARSIVDTILPGKPGEAKQSMPSFLRKTKPVMPRRGR